MNPFQQFVDAQQRDDVKNEDVIYFWRVNEKFGEFSQWYKSSFVCDGDTFSTAEQYMMYKKAMIFGDTEIANRILDTPHLHPHEHKKMGRMITNFDPDRWESESMRVVVNGNFRKFTQNNDLMKMLMNTGNKEIVEASPTDRIWGIGFSASHAMSNTMMWGENKLGKCLMTVRSMIADALSLMNSGVNSKIPVQTTTIALCYFCLSTTTMTPTTMAMDEHVMKLMITTCSDCMKMRGLAFGLVDRSTLTNMIACVPKETRMSDHIDMIADMDTHRIIHPDVLPFLDVNNCIVTKVRGFKDANGDLTLDWRQR